jgi:hypothetical protein
MNVEIGGWGRAIPRKGIYKRNCRCSVEGVKKIHILRWFHKYSKNLEKSYKKRQIKIKDL